MDRKDPQFKQIMIFGNAKIEGLSRLRTPEKWMFISESNSARLSDAHELQIERSVFMVFHSFQENSGRLASSRFQMSM